jgi:hypothetical protein
MNANSLTDFKNLISDELVIEVSDALKATPGFRDAFLSDPKGAYHRRFGKELLPGEEITTEARADGSKYLCLPRIGARFVVVSAVDTELSDQELEFAVGGTPAAPNDQKGMKFLGKLTGLDSGAKPKD